MRWLTSSRQPRRFDPAHQLVGAEGPLPRGTPDVDALGIQDQDVAVDPGEGRAQRVEAEGVVGGDKDGRIRRRVPKA